MNDEEAPLFETGDSAAPESTPSPPTARRVAYLLPLGCFAALLFAVGVASFMLWAVGADAGAVRINRDLDVAGHRVSLRDHPALSLISNFVPSSMFPPGANLVLGSLDDIAYASIRATTAVGTRVASAILSIPGELGLVELHTPVASIFSLPIVSFVGFFSPSDVRGKEKIKTLSTEQCLEMVGELRPVSFHWTDAYRAAVGLGSDDREQLGLIAQEVDKVVPQAITRTSMLLNDAEIDDWHDLDKEMLVPLLIGAIQELRRRIDELSQ